MVVQLAARANHSRISSRLNHYVRYLLISVDKFALCDAGDKRGPERGNVTSLSEKAAILFEIDIQRDIYSLSDCVQSP